MISLFDQDGNVAGYIAGDRLLNAEGDHVAFISNGSVYAYSGDHLGWWEGDHMVGSDGGTVVFQREVRTRPLKPLLSLEPLKPLAGLAPLKALPSLPPLKPFASLGWSANRFGNW